MGGLYINDNGTPKEVTGDNTALEDLVGDTDISDIGDGTVTGAIDELNSDLGNKQDKLTNPLTRSNIVNNLTSTSTTDVLSAAQGKVLNDSLNTKLTNAYKNNTSVKQGLKFDTNADNSFFTLRPILGQNLFQLTKSDSISLMDVYSSGETVINGRLNVSGGINNTGGWMDFIYNGKNRGSIYVNNEWDDLNVRSNISNLILEATHNAGSSSIMARVTRDFAVGNGNWTAGMPVSASAYNQWSTRLMKENIQSMTEEDGQKILDLNPVHFDFKEAFGGKKDNIGLIAEEALEVIPEIVNVPEDYDESEFDESKGLNNKLLTVDYVKLTLYLVKLCQNQQKQIDELTKRIEKLESK